MSKDSLNPGRVELCGMASLEDRCAVPAKGYSYIYDTIFTCADSASDGVGSFRTYVGRDKNKKKDGVYEIHAKMQLLQEEQVADLQDDIHISVAGIITSIEKFPPSFMMHTKQYTDGGASTDEITVRGCMENNPKWPDPAEHLPQQNQIIAFNGIL
ncbi:hypothetical protein EDB84DRAFT_1441894 [Lactarius hengduanensis]|nr:hypothetical protein EDB84DRAFT_1441894 [Lactarius hengduanensis]